MVTSRRTTLARTHTHTRARSCTLTHLITFTNDMKLNSEVCCAASPNVCVPHPGVDNDLSSAKALFDQMEAEGVSVHELSLKRLAVLYRNAGEALPFPEPPVSLLDAHAYAHTATHSYTRLRTPLHAPTHATTCTVTHTYTHSHSTLFRGV